MKLFQKIAVLISIALASCGSGNDVDYAEPLRACMNEKDVALLNEACVVFEDHLNTEYSTDNLSQAYREFLTDFSKYDIPPAFCLSVESKAILAEFRKTGLFEKIWQPSSVVLDRIYGGMFSREDYLPEGEEDLFILDPEAPFSICMRRVVEVKPLNRYFSSIEAMPHMSITFPAAELSTQLTDEDAANGLTRLAIAIGFFYQMAVMFE